jgi:hypothetical protein
MAGPAAADAGGAKKPLIRCSSGSVGGPLSFGQESREVKENETISVENDPGEWSEPRVALRRAHG